MLKLLFSVKRLAPSAQLELIQLVSIKKPEQREREGFKNKNEKIQILMI